MIIKIPRYKSTRTDISLGQVRFSDVASGIRVKHEYLGLPTYQICNQYLKKMKYIIINAILER